jgi:hypothetical protein
MRTWSPLASFLRLVLVFALMGCDATLESGLDEAQADAVVVALHNQGIGAEKQASAGNDPSFEVRVAADDVGPALRVLREAGLPAAQSPASMTCSGKGGSSHGHRGACTLCGGAGRGAGRHARAHRWGAGRAGPRGAARPPPGLDGRCAPAATGLGPPQAPPRRAPLRRRGGARAGGRGRGRMLPTDVAVMSVIAPPPSDSAGRLWSEAGAPSRSRAGRLTALRTILIGGWPGTPCWLCCWWGWWLAPVAGWGSWRSASRKPSKPTPP